MILSSLLPKSPPCNGSGIICVHRIWYCYLHKVVGLLPPAPGRVVELEGPQEVGGVLEVGADGEDLVDEVLHADDAHLAELGLDHLVGGDGGAVAVNLEIKKYNHCKLSFVQFFKK